jgi:SPP1 gp7 family putative phage head morphogenesis protein
MLRQLSQAYSLIDKSLNRQLRELMRDIEKAQREGKTVNRDWLRRSFRYQSLIRQVKAEVSGYSAGVSRFIAAKQQQASDLGQLHATSLITAALPEITFARLPTEAISELVGVMQDGTPLDKVLDKLGPEAARDIRDALITGLGSGHGAAKIAREVRRAIDMPRWNALRLARTEVLRAYRQSSLETYAANDDVLDGWYWLSAKSTRTCAACWDLRGTFFPLSKTFFPAHVACRCTSIPAVKGAHPNIQSGSVAFANLPVDQQQTILGPSRYEMYAQGASLDDFVILTRDKDWGGAYQVRPLWKMKSQRRAA